MAADAPPLLMRSRELLAKVETTTGTPIALTSADGAFLVYQPKFSPQVPFVQRPALDTSENLAGVRGAMAATIEFECDLMGAGASGLPSWATTFLPACNMVATGNTYKFVTAPATITTLTLGYNEMGRRRTISGAMGDWVIPLKNGEIGRIRFRFMGLINADADNALTAPTIPTVVPPRWANTSAISWGGYIPRVSTAEFRAGNNVVMRPDASLDAGYKSALVVSRDPTAVLDPESVLVAAKNWYTDHVNSTEAALTAVVGTVAGNIVTLTAPKAQIRERPSGERDQIITEGGLVFQFNRNGTTRDSEFSLAFS